MEEPSMKPSQRASYFAGSTRSMGLQLRVASVAGLLFVGGCDDGQTVETYDPNVVVFPAASVTTTDDGVLVAGVPHIDFGTGIRAIFLQHSTRFTYGGLYDRINDGLTDEGWYLDLRRHRVTVERADTVFRRGVDFGDVALDGAAANRTEINDPIITPRADYVRVLERYLLFRVLIYSRRYNMDGSEVTFVEEPFYERMVNGRPVTLSVTGTTEVEPASASFVVRPGPRVVALWNGAALDFENVMSELRPDQPLMLEVDRPLDPDKTIVRIFYAPPNEAGVSPEVRQSASAAFTLLDRSSRVVIPPSALKEIASNLPEAVGGFIIQISEYEVEDDVMDVKYSDGEEETFSVARASHFRIYARMPRVGAG
jgi:hypothetical protein